MNLVLLVEDDQRLASLVKDYLEAFECRVVIESSGHNVLRKVKDLKPDIVILDLMLPGKDGLTICSELRPKYEGPILILTAKDSADDQVKGLEFGADDYVTKPVEPRVLLARIRVLMRRFKTVTISSEKSLAFGQLNIDAESRRAVLGETHINLSSHEFDMLMELARKAGEIVSREYLYTTIYDREYDGLDRAVDVRISHLRKKLGDNAQKPEKIKTIWGKGYCFIKEAW